MLVDPVGAARHSASQGRTGEALARLTSAGDAASLFELAIWYLVGSVVPRDLAAARSWLRRAVAIGHDDAALMEIALAANGSGGAPDWPAALALLEAAARRDTLAAEHLALLRAMAIAPDGAPLALPEPRTLHRGPLVQVFPGLCTPAEANHIASVVVQLLEPATVFDPASGRMIAHPIRSSDNAAVGPTRETLVIQAINRRIAAATATAVTQGEPLTVLRYAPGQQYRPHLDALPDGTNQRVLTAILYLNDNYGGGQTEFPLLDLMIAPRAGDLLVFENLRPDGSPEPLSRHAGLPVASGVKWIATRWIRALPISPWAMSAEARAAQGG